MQFHWFTRIIALLSLLATPLVFAPNAASADAPSKARPNILVILVDDLGYGDLSIQGAGDLRTPHIDALAKSGMRFVNFYANCTVCSPTRASLLSGRYPDLVGVPGVIRTHPDDNWGYLSTNAILLPSLLSRAGYDTAIIGKWHLGLASPNTPTERGFDFFHGFLGDMMDDYYTHRRHNINYMRRNQTEIDPPGHATDLFTQWAVDYLEERRSQSRPFFLYLAYNAPHTPIQPPKEWLEKVRQRDPALTETRARLVALIEHLDDGIGRVLTALRTLGLADNTLVIFTSDNGGQLSAGANCGPYRGGKQDMYEGGLRVPMCAVWPGHIAAGSQSQVVALTMDLLPTLCDVAGVHDLPGIDGRSLWTIISGGESDQTLNERDLYWMRREGNNRYRGRDYHAIRRGHWKLLQNHPFEPYQLYDLTADPREEKDVSNQNPKVVQALNQSLQRHIQEAGRIPWQAPEGP